MFVSEKQYRYWRKRRTDETVEHHRKRIDRHHFWMAVHMISPAVIVLGFMIAAAVKLLIN